MRALRETLRVTVLAVGLAGCVRGADSHPVHLPQAGTASDSAAVIMLGDFRVRLDSTLLGDVRERFGGIIEQRGETAEHVSYLCYQIGGSDAGPTIGFESSVIGGDERRVTAVLLAAHDQTSRQCDSSGVSLEELWLPFGVRLGMGKDAFLQRLGSSYRAVDSLRVRYEFERPAANTSEGVSMYVNGGVEAVFSTANRLIELLFWQNTSN